MEKILKEWRQDAVNKHQYESAIYIGDKLLAITSEHILAATLRYANAYQMTLRMPSGWPKSTSRRAITLELRASLRNITLSITAHHANTSQLTAISSNTSSMRLLRYSATRTLHI